MRIFEDVAVDGLKDVALLGPIIGAIGGPISGVDVAALDFLAKAEFPRTAKRAPMAEILAWMAGSVIGGLAEAGFMCAM